MDIFRELGLPVERIVCSGGGSRSALWRQIQADVFGVPVEWRCGDEHSATGAAVVAGTATGRVIPHGAGGHAAGVAMPDGSAVETYRSLRTVYKKIYPQNAEIFHELSSIAAGLPGRPSRA